MLIFCIRSSEIFCAWGGRQKRVKQQSFKESNTELSREPAIPLLGTCPRELEIYVHIKACTQMFISAIFTITSKWNWPKCLTSNQWLNKMWYIHVMKYYSSIKRKRLQIHTTTWIKLENTKLQKEVRHKRHILSTGHKILIGYWAGLRGE